MLEVGKVAAGIIVAQSGRHSSRLPVGADIIPTLETRKLNSREIQQCCKITVSSQNSQQFQNAIMSLESVVPKLYL